MTSPLPPGIPAARFVDPDRVPWRVAVGYDHPGAEEKILYDDEATGTYVRLLRWPPGFLTGDQPLCHEDFDEFAWVVEGSSVSLTSGERYGAGSFCVVPRGTLHGPFTTVDGVLLLEMRQPTAKGGSR